MKTNLSYELNKINILIQTMIEINLVACEGIRT